MISSKAREMGKNLHLPGSNSSSDGHGSGKMKGLLHHFPHNPWNKVKKKLPHKKKHLDDTEGNKTSSEAAEKQNSTDSAIDNSTGNGENWKKSSQHHHIVAKGVEPGRLPKSSVKSRIKALITEEMSKKKGSHQRSSSCPVKEPLDPPIPIHRQPEPSTAEAPAEGNNSGEVLKGHSRVHPVALLDPVLPKVGEDSSTSCSSNVSINYLKQSEVEKIVQQPVRDHTFLQDNSIYAVEPSKDASLQESKLFMDALDLLNMRKEVFMRIVQDKSSSLAQQMQVRRNNNLRPGLTKSVTFPVPRSPSTQVHEHENSPNRQGNESCVKKGDGLQHLAKDDMELAMSKHSNMENVIASHLSKDLKVSNNDADASSSSSYNMLRNMHNNKVSLHHFKKLKAKLKVAIRGKKEEKYHIVRDALQHKVPYGEKVSNDKHGGKHMTPESRADQFSKYGTDGSRIQQHGSEFMASQLKSFNRSSSFVESFDRYNRLLEICSNSSATSTTDSTFSTISKKLPQILERNLSLPEFRSSPSMRIEDSSANNSLEVPETTAVGNVCAEASNLTEQTPLDEVSENKLQPSVLIESESQEDELDIMKTAYDWVNSKAWEGTSSDPVNVEPMPSSPPQPSEQNENLEDDSISEDDKISLADLTMSEPEDLEKDSAAIQQVDIGDKDALESKIKQYYDDLSHVQVDAKNEAEFNYVKEVLELSGFSRDEILGQWHSAAYAVDPMVFDEVEWGMAPKPGWSGNEDDEISDHLFLFDLINEVLLGIYERSCCYWPMPLTLQSHIRSMPKGHCVLGEVWTEISWLLCCNRVDIEQAVDDVVSLDLAKRDGWMNLQFDGECVGLEVEDLIIDDLLEEIILPLENWSA